MSSIAARQGRTKYPIACAAGRTLLERANKADPQLRASELRVVNAVVAYTALHSKTEDSVSVKQIADFAGLHRKTAARILRSLNAREDLGLVYVGGRGKHNCSTITLPKRELYAVPFTENEKGIGTPVSEPQKGTQSAPKGSAVRGERSHTEKDVTEKDVNQSVEPTREASDVSEEKLEDQGRQQREVHHPEPLIAMTERIVSITSRPAAKDARRNEARRAVIHCRKANASDLLIDECIGLAAEREAEYVSGVLATIRKVAEEDHGIFIPHLQLRGGTPEDRDPEAEAREQRARAIENCARCDDNGHVLGDNDEVARCLHGEKPKPATPRSATVASLAGAPMPDDIRKQLQELTRNMNLEEAVSV